VYVQASDCRLVEVSLLRCSKKSVWMQGYKMFKNTYMSIETNTRREVEKANWSETKL